MNPMQQKNTNTTLSWLQSQISSLGKGKQTTVEELERQRQEQMEKDAAIQELKSQQEDIQRKLMELQGQTKAQANPSNTTADMLLHQLRSALSGKKEDDPNKALLRALITQQNKSPGEGGTNTLKPDLLSRMVEGENLNMAEWLANLNGQEEGEFDINRFPFPGEEEIQGRQAKARSGILDKATTNIQRKQVWPQQNLGEDWTDEDVEFKQMKFEHLVAGETRTIETCSEPAEILGRLRLLHRLAYLKLRGYEWNLIRKMYAAILTSIETKEYSWESNFDQFETILYRRTAVEGRAHQA